MIESNVDWSSNSARRLIFFGVPVRQPFYFGPTRTPGPGHLILGNGHFGQIFWRPLTEACYECEYIKITSTVLVLRRHTKHCKHISQ